MTCQLIFLEKDRCFLELASFHIGRGHEESKHASNIARQICAQLGMLTYNNSAIILQGTTESIRSKTLL